MLSFFLFGLPQGGELIIIGLIILILFGAKKIPEFMKGLGKGVKGFKDGMKEIQDEINSEATSGENKAKEDANSDQK